MIIQGRFFLLENIFILEVDFVKFVFPKDFIRRIIGGEERIPEDEGYRIFRNFFVFLLFHSRFDHDHEANDQINAVR